jgi:hypothetical protein
LVKLVWDSLRVCESGHHHHGLLLNPPKRCIRAAQQQTLQAFRTAGSQAYGACVASPCAYVLNEPHKVPAEDKRFVATG